MALSDKDQTRADQFFSMICGSNDLRNRNPLHPTPLDSAVIGNLLNFPKHIFGFPYAGWSTNGHEALSLCLYSYRQECKMHEPRVLYVLAENEDDFFHAIEACCIRLRMKFEVMQEKEFLADTVVEPSAVVMVSLANPSLRKVAEWAGRSNISVHIHVW